MDISGSLLLWNRARSRRTEATESLPAAAAGASEATVSNGFLVTVILLPTAAVVIAIFAVLRRAGSTTRQLRMAVIAGIVLAAWAMVEAVLAYRGFFRPPVGNSFPPIGSNLLVVLVSLGAILALSSPLRALLANQKHLIWLNVWRLLGAVFLILMAMDEVPALWALPAGIGDIIVGAAAPFVAARLDKPRGKSLATIFHVFGMADLVVAVALGVMTNPGPVQLFSSHPTSELLTAFPLALVPTFLVPLAFTLHVVSLWQLRYGTWAARSHAMTA